VSGKRAAAASRTFVGLLQYAEELAHAADEKPLLLHLDPGSGGGRKDDVIAGLDWHAHADVIPPVQAGTDGEHDALLGRWLVGAGRYHQARPAHPVGIELLDDHTVK
jgi:hypothetical protein